MSDLLEKLNAEIGSVVEAVTESLVQVNTVGRGNGSGVLCHPEGLIITNAHVVRGPAIEVALSDGRTLPARLLARDTNLDLAALYVEASGLPAVSFGESQLLRPGQMVLALGHPWGVHGAVTAGVVIGVGPQWPYMPHSGREWIGVSLPLRPGNSGGPLIDVAGRVIGINTMITGPHVGMAVPVHVVKAFLHQKLGSKEAVPV